MNFIWKLGQQNLITFPLVDVNGTEVAGLGGGFTLRLSLNGAVHANGLGTKAEIGLGWYSYLATAGEASNYGVVAVAAWGTGTTQQNMEFVVEERTIYGLLFTYTVASAVNGLPLAGVKVAVAADSLGSRVIWVGLTDALGVARDGNGNLPRLDPGTYYIFRQLAGYIFVDPDVEVVS